MAIAILFHDFADSTDKSAYVAAKLKAFFEYGGRLGSAPSALVAVPQEEIARWTDFVITHLTPSAPVPLVAKTDYPAITAAQQKIVDASTACFIQEIDARSPLLPGEYLVEAGDTVSYLAGDYGPYPGGTPVLRRQTNRATLYYLADHLRVQTNGDLTPVPSSVVEPLSHPLVQSHLSALRTPSLQTAGDDGGISTAEQIAKGLVWALPPPYSAIGATLLNVLFPDSVHSIDWPAVFKQFAEIVLEADTETTVHTQCGLLNGVLSDINDYKNIRFNLSKAERTSKLNDYLETTNGIVGVLLQGQFAQKGLATFVHAAGVELAILQEMAKEDPTVSDPLQSGHLTTIATNAASYAQFATTTLNAILDNLTSVRLQAVSDVQQGQHCHYVQGGGTTGGDVVCTSYYYFTDTTANFTSSEYTSTGKHDNPENDCNVARSQYVAPLGPAYRASESRKSQWLWNVTTWWQKLEQTPLPQAPYSG